MDCYALFFLFRSLPEWFCGHRRMRLLLLPRRAAAALELSTSSLPSSFANCKVLKLNCCLICRNSVRQSFMTLHFFCQRYIFCFYGLFVCWIILHYSPKNKALNISGTNFFQFYVSILLNKSIFKLLIVMYIIDFYSTFFFIMQDQVLLKQLLACVNLLTTSEWRPPVYNGQSDPQIFKIDSNF
jgi:hypothetical protein